MAFSADYGAYNMGPGVMDGPCTSAKCQHLRIKPRATFFYKASNRWVCLACAQEINRRHVQLVMLNIREGNPQGQPQCISSKEYMWETLTKD